MALLDLNHSELTTIQLALSNAKLDLIARDGRPTKGLDAIAAKVTAALIEEQKDIDFEKRRNAILS